VVVGIAAGRPHHDYITSQGRKESACWNLAQWNPSVTLSNSDYVNSRYNKCLSEGSNCSKVE